jgi:hypothetical protein
MFVLEEFIFENRVLVFQNYYFELYNKIWVQVEKSKLAHSLFCTCFHNLNLVDSCSGKNTFFSILRTFIAGNCKPFFIFKL